MNVAWSEAKRTDARLWQRVGAHYRLPGVAGTVGARGRVRKPDATRRDRLAVPSPLAGAGRPKMSVCGPGCRYSESEAVSPFQMRSETTLNTPAYAATTS